MKIYRSFSELVTVLLLIIVAIAFLMYTLLNNSMSLKYTSMKNSGIIFSNAVSNNLYSFSSDKKIYLDEVISDKYISNIKSPFSSGACDITQSFVKVDDNGEKYVTLFCDNYILYEYKLSDYNEYIIYKVSDWTTKKENNISEERELFNCIDKKTKKKIFDDYYDEEYFIYKMNKKYNRRFNSVTEIDDNIQKSRKP